MPISQEDFDELTENMVALEEALYQIENIIKDANPSLYERWKTYGKHVTNEFVIGGPSLPEVIEQLEEDIEKENDDDDDEPEDK